MAGRKCYRCIAGLSCFGRNVVATRNPQLIVKFPPHDPTCFHQSGLSPQSGHPQSSPTAMIVRGLVNRLFQLCFTGQFFTFGTRLSLQSDWLCVASERNSRPENVIDGLDCGTLTEATTRSSVCNSNRTIRHQLQYMTTLQPVLRLDASHPVYTCHLCFLTQGH